MWSYPPWINQTKAAEVRKQMEDQNIIYGGSESYRHMCRFYSGFFFRHELVQNYDYYWRLEPGVSFTCDINYDPFKFIQKNNITYGFTISMLEILSTVPTLWNTVKDFINEYPHCHFWSNFEIGDLNFWRSEKYIKFFEYLDQIGGFYYERWGDAPVHSIALTLFLEKSKIHFFNDIGYEHPPYQHCPIGEKILESGRCHCNYNISIDFWPGSCVTKWFEI
ncbi:glycosyltransferase family 15 protein [Gigaspora margarita]|uniref:Glycosyltransferase family 15 protein n=1 Tax=Gigaspora margarita TaxID=4874 RepID=A0A8H4AQ69_GIGMA|nr:glycosyltransferase family 15 protein [Gigaspora margarita]